MAPALTPCTPYSQTETPFSSPPVNTGGGTVSSRAPRPAGHARCGRAQTRSGSRDPQGPPSPLPRPSPYIHSPKYEPYPCFLLTHLPATNSAHNHQQIILAQARAARGGRSRGQQVAKALELATASHAKPYSADGNGAEAYATAAVSRLEQGTRRLARQYEDLQREVDGLANSQSHTPS